MKQILQKLKKTWISGEMTVEASVVVPMVILVISFVLYVSFYLHDIVVTNAFAYSRMIEVNNCNNKDSVQVLAQKAVENAPVFMVNNILQESKEERIKMNSNYNFPIRWIREIANTQESVTISFEKSMNTEIMYMCRVVGDFMEE